VLAAWKYRHYIYHKIQTIEILIYKEVTINFENDVTLDIIAFCYKRSFLTRNGLLLQTGMQMELHALKDSMRQELNLHREQRREEILAMKVSPPTQVQICNLYSHSSCR
jgi:hypothetical protein